MSGFLRRNTLFTYLPGKHWLPRDQPQVPPLRSPGFPVEVGGAAIFMRFSLQKTAHAALSSAASRKSGYAPNDTDRRVGSATTPLKPKEGLNGPPKLCLVISSLNLPQAS
jgi:hypothetical protein